MKGLVFILTAASLGILLLSGAAQARLYNCVRPDGSVVCTVEAGGDPSGACNSQCKDCNQVCTAQERIIHDNGKTTVIPSGPEVGKRIVPPPSGAVETREYCQQRFAQCKADCRKNPGNDSSFNLEACLSSCSDTMSGCGTKPSDY